MAANRPLSGAGHGSVAGLLDYGAFEAFIDREPEHERITGREAALHLVEIGDQALVRHRAVGHRIFVGLGRWPLGELRDDIRPLGLWAHTIACHRLDAIP